MSPLIDKIARVIRDRRHRRSLPELPLPFSKLEFSGHALHKAIVDYTFESVLDVGCGEGLHSDIFLGNGKKVTALDYGQSVYFRRRAEKGGLERIIGDFNQLQIDRRFDCVWCSHVLEHQPNPQIFLQKLAQQLNPDGLLAITVPPAKHEIVGGHLTLWNAGLLIYNLILAGFDCRRARALKYGYNISVLVEYKPVDVRALIEFDSGDIRKLRPFFPAFEFRSTPTDDIFDGDINEINWF